MMSPSDEKRIVTMVDSFTKTVARNFSRNLKRAKANAEKHYSDEPVDYLLETLSHDDRYPSDYSGRAKLTFKCREFAATPSRKR